MPKYYVAEVTVVTKYEVRVSSLDDSDPEQDATEKAKKIVSDKNKRKKIASHIGNVELKFDGETKFGIGQKIKHPIFGVGVITDLIRTTHGNNKKGETATIEFEDSVVKRIALSFIDQKIEIIE
jgi:hypothetical protein